MCNPLMLYLCDACRAFRSVFGLLDVQLVRSLLVLRYVLPQGLLRLRIAYGPITVWFWNSDDLQAQTTIVCLIVGCWYHVKFHISIEGMLL